MSEKPLLVQRLTVKPQIHGVRAFVAHGSASTGLRLVLG